VRRLDTNPGEAGYDRRWDLVQGALFQKALNIQDLTALLGGTTGYPPMFGGDQAFGQTCVP
jgi:hypothetical protein